MILTFLLCWSPVLLLMLLTIVLKRSAFFTSIASVIFTTGLVTLFFYTPLTVAFLAAVDGMLTTLPLILVVFAGILLTHLLMATGSLHRIVVWLTSGVRSPFYRELLIALGIGNFMEGSGVAAEPVVASMLRAADVSPEGSAALSIIGYAGLMTLELAGIIITVLALVTGISISELGVAVGWLSIPATVMMAAVIPFYLPPSSAIKGWYWIAMAAGLWTSVVTLAVAAYVGVSLSGMVGGLALILILLLFGSRRLPVHKEIVRDVTPFLLLLVCMLAVNVVPFLQEWTYQRLVVPVRVIPIHTITFQPFFSPYLYLFLACVVTVFLFQMPKSQWKPVLSRSARIGLKVSLTMGMFGAMGQMVAYSGYTELFEINNSCNIPWLMAQGMKDTTGGFYPLFVPLLGWVGTFLTGYGVASIMLFGQLQVETAQMMGISATWMAAALAVGASLGSVSSPFKVALAAPMCDAVGKEGSILRWTIPLGIAASFGIGVILWGIL